MKTHIAIVLIAGWIVGTAIGSYFISISQGEDRLTVAEWQRFTFPQLTEESEIGGWRVCNKVFGILGFMDSDELYTIDEFVELIYTKCKPNARLYHNPEDDV